MITRLRRLPTHLEANSRPSVSRPLRRDSLPLPADGLTALERLLAELHTRCGEQGAAVRSLLAGLHRSFALLVPGYPTAAAPAALWGFSPAPAGSLDELDAQLNRLEDVLLQLLPNPDEADAE